MAWRDGWAEHECIIDKLIAEVDAYDPEDPTAVILREALHKHLTQAKENAKTWKSSPENNELIKEKLSNEDFYFNMFNLVLSLSSSEFPTEWKVFFEDELALNDALRKSL